MATLSVANPTLLDVANMPGNEDVKDIVELMAQFNPILVDALALPCNKGDHHVTTVRTGLPAVAWGKLYQGVASTKGTRQQVKDTTGFMESAAEVDQRLVDVVEAAMDKASIRADEAAGHYEAMSQEAASAIFYHDTNVDPSKPMGLAPRFNDLTIAENKSQIIDAGGTGSDNTSIWMITWSKQTVHLIYPKAGKAGIERKDRGVQPKLDANNLTYFVYREDFTWHLGISVRDWRYVSRVCNIDVSLLSKDAASGADLIDAMTDMYFAHFGRKKGAGKTIIYANTTIVKYLDFQVRNATNKNLFLTLDKTGPNAEEVLAFRGIPIHETDALLETEARVV